MKLDKTTAENSPQLLTSIGQPIPSFSNARVDCEEKKICLRQLLRQKSLIPAQAGTSAYLDAIFVKKKDGTYRLVVNGEPENLRRRKLYSPRLPFTSSVTEAVSKAAKRSITEPWMSSADLSAGYYQVRLHKNQDPLQLLTIRLQGRVYIWKSPPQGLAASTSICVAMFHEWWTLLNATASYSDNAVWNATTKEGAEKKMRSVQEILAYNGISLSTKEKDCQMGRQITFLGATISHGRISLTNTKIFDYARTSNDPVIRAGNHSYFNDLFGTSIIPEKILKTNDLKALTYQFASQDKVIVDGQKARFAAAIIMCGSCAKIKEHRITRCPQASQATAEQKALLNGAYLAHKRGIDQVATDHQALTFGSSRKNVTLLLYKIESGC
eukprot:GHVH01005384.1.p1 GENE.GHVH01005384.1~~GHVH01005384.1.p1  ORF type:complete len:383 (+),score=29.15 GHVH01005384.1:93-1241(+)